MKYSGNRKLLKERNKKIKNSIVKLFNFITIFFTSSFQSKVTFSGRLMKRVPLLNCFSSQMARLLEFNLQWYIPVNLVHYIHIYSTTMCRYVRTYVRLVYVIGWALAPPATLCLTPLTLGYIVYKSCRQFNKDGQFVFFIPGGRSLNTRFG